MSREKSAAQREIEVESCGQRRVVCDLFRVIFANDYDALFAILCGYAYVCRYYESVLFFSSIHNVAAVQTLCHFVVQFSIYVQGIYCAFRHRLAL